MADMVRYEPVPMGPERLGAILVKSGFFRDAKDESQAIVKILLGGELGFGPIASMMNIYVVEGKPSMSAQLIASCVQKSGIFNYRVRKWTDEVCEIEFFERNESVGLASFSIRDAERANLVKKTNWATFPKAMLWARAMSQGARAYCPSLFNGAVYSVEELHDEPDIVDTSNGRVDTKTGEVLEKQESADDEERDMITSADDPDWQKWLSVLARAQNFGLNPDQNVLPLDRNDLKAYAETVLMSIRDRKATLAKIPG